ncbi:hypothetical protein PG994_007984 [Apiospora phragmitis]|uniref:Uncharacterized protein n=1 Tax=Apiospora phragmitis TaxID=2905665 RepID=A0ABR1URR1_9PEZI
MARRIMINACEDIQEHGWPADTPLPYLIWWPLRPTQDTLLLLAEKVPQMKEQVIVAAIYCNYETAYRMISVRPTHHIWEAARNSPNPLYREDLKMKAEELKIKYSHLSLNMYDPDLVYLAWDLEPTGMSRHLNPDRSWTTAFVLQMGHIMKEEHPTTGDSNTGSGYVKERRRRLLHV